tara:strand:- start:760 stop:1773 length:1014 start_codon:yes stop_codon:yes gene_type:complete
MIFFFIVDSRKQSGLGHLKRSFLLVKELEKLGHKNYIFCNKIFFNQEVNNKSSFVVFRKKKLKDNMLLIKKKIELVSPDFIIFDTYEINQGIIDTIKKTNKKIMVIHDYKFFRKNINIYLNYNCNSNSNSNSNINTDLLLGSKFTLVKKTNKHPRHYNKEIKNILLFFGGSDSNNLNLNFLKLFKDKTFEKYKFNFILGPNIKNRKIIEDNFKLTRFNKKSFNRNFQKNLYECDLYMGTGGSSMWDVLITRTPGIFFPINKNQKKNCSQLNQKKKIVVENVKNLNKSEYMKKKLINYFNNYKSIKNIAKLNLNLVDGLGPKRIVNCIINYDRAKIKN